MPQKTDYAGKPESSVRRSWTSTSAPTTADVQDPRGPCGRRRAGTVRPALPRTVQAAGWEVAPPMPSVDNMTRPAPLTVSAAAVRPRWLVRLLADTAYVFAAFPFGIASFVVLFTGFAVG